MLILNRITDQFVYRKNEDPYLLKNEFEHPIFSHLHQAHYPPFFPRYIAFHRDYPRVYPRVCPRSNVTVR